MNCTGRKTVREKPVDLARGRRYVAPRWQVWASNYCWDWRFWEASGRLWF